LNGLVVICPSDHPLHQEKECIPRAMNQTSELENYQNINIFNHTIDFIKIICYKS